MGIKVGIAGTGSFAQHFIPLFKSHPLVDNIVLCDLDKKKLEENAIKHHIDDTCQSLDDLCDMDVDSIVIMTQNWLHGPQSEMALMAGKNVYSAVPAAITVDEMEKIVTAVKKTGKIYMIGETSYYQPNTIYCREQFKKGAFGHIVFGIAHYYHDWSHGGEALMKKRGGANWRNFAGAPPMLYPTHSISLFTSVTGEHAINVSGLGFVDRENDNIFNPTENTWKNAFSNETALMEMSDGSSCCIQEYRRIGHGNSVNMSLMGTKGCYLDDSATEEKFENAFWTNTNNDVKRLGKLLEKKDIPADEGKYIGVSEIHDIKRLPVEFVDKPNGHAGSHQFLVDDFVKACFNKKTPPNNVWDAARYLIPGLIAHESAKLGGKRLAVPDFGDVR